MKKLLAYKHQISVAILFITMLFLHLFRLGDLPYAINIDEAGLWYNIKSLMTLGVDQAGKSWPLLFANYYSEQSAMYTYLALICCKIFGESLLVLRIPAVLNICVIFIFGYKIVNHLYKNTKINMLFCLFCTIFPYFIINGRIALDCNLMLGFSTMFLWFLIQAIHSDKWYYFLIAGICGGFVFYTYAISYITVPLFVILSGIYLIRHKKITIAKIFIFLVPIVLLGMPLLTIQIINIFDLPEINILGITLSNFESPRHSDIGIQNVLAHLIVYGKYILFGEEISLMTSTIYCGNFYIVSIPFMFIGLVNILKGKEFSEKKFIVFWLLSTFLTIMLIKQGIRGYQTNALMFGCIILIIDGIVFAVEKITHSKLKHVFIYLLIVLYILSFGGFFYHYYCGAYNDNVYFYENSNTDFSEVIQDVEDGTTVYCAVKSVYYKLALNKDPIENPFVYERTYNEYGECISLREKIYENDNFVFDNLGGFLNNIDYNAIYIIPLKEQKMMEKMNDNSNFSCEIINSYAIFRPIEK